MLSRHQNLFLFLFVFVFVFVFQASKGSVTLSIIYDTPTMIFQLPETYRNYLKGNIAKGTISCLHFSMTFGSIFQRWRHKFSGLDFKYLFVYQQNYVDYKNKSNNYQKVLIPIIRPAFCSARRVLPRQLPVAVAGTTR